MFKMLHTSDWHLGAQFHRRKRYEEFDQFLAFLLKTVELEKPDLMVVSGDIYDSSLPSNRAQEQFFTLLGELSKRCCNLILTGGNHDSPTLLDAPKKLLKSFGIHIEGAYSGNPEEFVIPVTDRNGTLIAAAAAIPFLPERDLITLNPGEEFEDRNRRKTEALKQCFRDAADRALKLKGDQRIPLICTGHLPVSGAAIREDDGVREVYVGNMERLGPDIFPDVFDYAALGHIHIPQTVSDGTKPVIRYSGSPLPMGFDDGEDRKSLTVVEFSEDCTPAVREIPVPCFVRTCTVREAKEEELFRKVGEMTELKQPVRLRVIHTGAVPSAGLKQKILDLTAGTMVDPVIIQDTASEQQFNQTEETETELSDLTPETVFLKCLDYKKITEEAARTDLLELYRTILRDYEQKDRNAQ